MTVPPVACGECESTTAVDVGLFFASPSSTRLLEDGDSTGFSILPAPLRVLFKIRSDDDAGKPGGQSVAADHEVRLTLVRITFLENCWTMFETSTA